MLDEVKFGADDWPTINNWHGAEQASGFALRRDAVAQKFEIRGKLHGKKLFAPGLQQWPQSQEPAYEMSGGKLVLSGRPEFATNAFEAIFARSTLTGDYHRR